MSRGGSDQPGAARDHVELVTLGRYTLALSRVRPTDFPAANMFDTSAHTPICCPWQHTLIVDDHALFRAGAAQLLRQSFPQLRISEAGDLAQAERALTATHGAPIDLVLLDLGLPEHADVQALHALRRVAPDVAVIVVSGQADAATALACMQAGAMGYIHKSTDAERFMSTVAGALRGVICLPESLAGAGVASAADQARGLSPRQKDVLVALLQGHSNKRIALSLGVAESTVKTHLSEVMRTLGVQTRVQALVALAGVPPERWR